jgi:hypothetical protein
VVDQEDIRFFFSGGSKENKRAKSATDEGANAIIDLSSGGVHSRGKPFAALEPERPSVDEPIVIDDEAEDGQPNGMRCQDEVATATVSRAPNYPRPGISY